MRIKISAAKKAAENRSDGYLEDILYCSKVVGEFAEISRHDYDRIKAKYATPQKPWPIVFRMISKLKSESDLGVGDTIARAIGPFGGDAFKAWTKSIGIPCKCDMRQAKLNELYPYKNR